MAKNPSPEMEKAEKQLQAFENSVSTLTLDRMNEAPEMEVEPQTKISQKELAKSKDIYLKPFRSIGSREKFNEEFRDQWNHAKEYVCFTAENHEIIGEDIDIGQNHSQVFQLNGGKCLLISLYGGQDI